MKLTRQIELAKSIVVLGIGGFGREALDVIQEMISVGRSDWEIAGAADSNASAENLQRLSARGVPFLGTEAELLRSTNPSYYIIGIGNPESRALAAARFDDAGWMPAIAIHPSATVGSESVIAPGTVICSGVQISTNVSIARHVHVNPNAIIGHDARISEFVSINPGAIVSGSVQVGRRALLGAGSIILQGLRVQDMALVGAGACVTREVGAGTTVVGIPARILEGQK